MIITALTLCQPYASMCLGLIPGHLKTIETRRWATHFRGELLICAGQRVLPGPSHYRGPDPASLPRGVALGIVTVTDCRPVAPGEWPACQCDPYPGAFGIHLVDPRPIEPFPVSGAQRWFKVDLDLRRRVTSAARTREPVLF